MCTNMLIQNQSVSLSLRMKILTVSVVMHNPLLSRYSKEDLLPVATEILSFAKNLGFSSELFATYIVFEQDI